MPTSIRTVPFLGLALAAAIASAADDAPRGAPVIIFAMVSGDGVGSVVSDPAGINCPGACFHGFEQGTLLRLTATPQAGYVFTRWTGGPCESSANPVCEFTVQQSDTAGAEFRTQQNLSVLFEGLGSGRVTSAPVGADCTSNCFVQFPTGTTVTLTATPAPGSQFAGWITSPFPGDCVGPVPTCTLSMTTARIARPRFDPIPPTQYQLDVFLAGEGQGTVTGMPGGINCPGVCGGDYPENAVVTLTATPQPGSTFVQWTGACSGSATSCQVTMASDLSVFAQFGAVPVEHALDVFIKGAGSGRILSAPAGIDCPGDCAHSYPQFQQIVLTPHPDIGNVFAGWQGACAPFGTAPCTLMMSQAYTVIGAFGSDGDVIFQHGFE